MSRLLWLVVHLYSCLIRLYPVSFREAFEAEMITVFANVTREAAQISRTYLVVVILRELRDYPFSLLREYRHHFIQLDPSLMITIKKVDWYFYPAWIISAILSVPIAFASYWGLIRIIESLVGSVIYVDGVRHLIEDYLVEYIFFPMISLLMGVFQYGLLRRYLLRMGGWVWVTLIGWLLTFILVDVWWDLLTRFWPTEVVYASPALNPAFVILGFSVGTWQWLLLRRRLPHAGWWIVANGVGWGLLRLVIGESLTSFGELLALGGIPACITAVTLALLMNQIPPSEPQKVPADEAHLV